MQTLNQTLNQNLSRTLNPARTISVRNLSRTLCPTRTVSVQNLSRTPTPQSHQSPAQNQLPVLRRRMTEPALFLLPRSGPPASDQLPVLGKNLGSVPYPPPPPRPRTSARFTAPPPDLILWRRTGPVRATAPPPWRRFLWRQSGAGPVLRSRVPP